MKRKDLFEHSGLLEVVDSEQFVELILQKLLAVLLREGYNLIARHRADSGCLLFGKHLSEGYLCTVVYKLDRKLEFFGFVEVVFLLHVTNDKH